MHSRGHTGRSHCVLKAWEHIDMNAEIWASLGTAVATILFLVIPGLVYAWYALDEWIGDRDSYAEVISAVEHTGA